MHVLKLTLFALAATFAFAVSSCATPKAGTKSASSGLVQLHKAPFQKDRMNHFANTYEGVFTRKLGQGEDARTLYIVLTRIWQSSGQVWFYNTVFMDNLPEEPLERCRQG